MVVIKSLRRYMNLGIRYQDIYDKHFQGRLFYDEKLRKAPAVIIISGSEGRIEKSSEHCPTFIF